ncbi:PH domain-containing protein [Pseudactinotalea sp. Z1732]|uniref:PH domain-containing protein n=1 Tax=Micrococcales TaxID=85006 RepID=UPI003C7B74CB
MSGEEIRADDTTRADISGDVATSTAPLVQTDAPWQRLHSRMIWVDALQTVISLAPGIVAITVFDVEADMSSMWPFVAIAVFGVLGAISDALRWVFTRYRVSEDYVERRTGVLVRRYRSVRRDRIRSVDVEARLRHRLSGLRIVRIGAGQQSAAGEAAFDLDAVLAADAEQLQRILLRDRRRPSSGTVAAGRTPQSPDDGDHQVEAESTDAGSQGSDDPMPERAPQILSRLQPRWVLYNLFNIWALVLAAGVLWGGFWLAATFNLDVLSYGRNLVAWDDLDWAGRTAIAVGVVAMVGVLGMAITFFTSHWRFELSRVFGAETTMLRTRQGLFHTKEVNRDEGRIRGVAIAEPLLWRWLGVTDTTVITTGLDAWSSSDPTTILPRGPRAVACRVGGEVLQTDVNPITAPLQPHPGAALRRRLWWALATAAIVTGVLWWLARTDVIGFGWIWTGAVLLPFAVGAALVAYRALGHTIAGAYVVMRSGLLSRYTTALQRDAVSTVAVSESLLQRRLGLRSVSAMTAAGDGAYDAPDVPADSAAELANLASDGLLEPFLVHPGRPAD